MYDFTRCKLCATQTAEPAFHLKVGTLYRCHSCDLHFLDQLDEIEQIEAASKGLTEAAWNYIEARVDESEALLPHRLALVKEFLSLPEAHCLDLGAGVGQFMQRLQAEQARVVGIEPSAVRRAYMQRKFGFELRPELVEEDYWQNRFRAKFDAICLWDVIEHLNFPAETVENAAQLLKPGGYLFLDTPSRATFAYRISEKACRLSGGQLPLFLDNFYSAAAYGHKQIFTRQQLQQLMERNGLQICALRKSYRPGLLRGDKIVLACRKPLAAKS